MTGRWERWERRESAVPDPAAVKKPRTARLIRTQCRYEASAEKCNNAAPTNGSTAFLRFHMRTC